MITPEQIRAARGLLGWTQLELAKNCSLSKTAVNNIEHSLVKARSQTLEVMKRKFEEYGVEFLGASGVNLKREIFRVQVFEGQDSITRYLEDVVATLKGTGLEALHSNVDDKTLLKHGYRTALYAYYEDFIRYGLRERLLICEGDDVCYGPPETSRYRGISKEVFSQTGYAVYGNKYCIFTFDKTNRIISIENALIADVYRRQFEFHWKRAKPISNAQCLYYQDRK